MSNEKGKFVSMEHVNNAITKAEGLIIELKKIQRSRTGYQNIDASIQSYVKYLEDGKSWESVVEQFKTDLFLTLIESGYNTDKKLAQLLNKKTTTLKVWRCERKIYFRKK